MISQACTLALAVYPTTKVPAPAMYPGHPGYGSIEGIICYDDYTTRVPGAYVAIVNANDLTQVYYEGTTDAKGWYRFDNVNNSWQPDGYGRPYKIFARDAAGNEGYSNYCVVEENNTMQVSSLIFRPSTPTVTPTPMPSPSPTLEPASIASPSPIPSSSATPTPSPSPVPQTIPASQATSASGTSPSPVPTAMPVQAANLTIMDFTITPTPSQSTGQTNITAAPATSTPVPPGPVTARTESPGFEAILTFAGLISFVVYSRLKNGLGK